MKRLKQGEMIKNERIKGNRKGLKNPRKKLKFPSKKPNFKRIPRQRFKTCKM